MSYKRVTLRTDEVIEVAKNKYMPAIKAMGALDCEFVQTGPDSTIVITTHSDKAAADTAAEKAAELRVDGQERFKSDVLNVLEGEVIVTM